MTTKQREIVQSSFAKVIPISGQAADLFYGRLFGLDPSLQALFKGDMRVQKKKLIQMLAAAVDGLGDLETLVPIVRDLGAQHGRYGVQDKDYGTVAKALLWTLEEALVEDFTPDVKEAWIAVYEVLASTMKEAARPVAAV